MTAAKSAIALLAVAVALAPMAPAAADPVPPAEPVPAPAEPLPAPPGPAGPTEFVPVQSGIGNPLGQMGSPSGPLGLPDLSAYGTNLLLGQNAQPTAPGAPTGVAVPNLSAFNPEYLLGLNTDPAAPGDGTTAPGLAPDQDIPGTGRIAFLRRLYEMYQAGALRGSLLGQQSPDEFAEQAAAAAAPSSPG